MIRNKNRYCDRYYICFAIAMLFFVCPEFFTSLPVVGEVVYALKYVAGWALLAVLFPKIKIRFGIPHILVLLFCATYCFALFRTDTFDLYYFGHIITIVFFLILLETVHSDEEIWISFLRAVRDIVFFFFVIALAYFVAFPNSVERLNPTQPVYYYFLGHVLALGYYIFPGIIASILLSEKNGKLISVQTVVFYVGFVLTSIFVYIMLTSLVGMTFIFFWSLLRNKHKHALPFLFLLVVLIVAALNYFVVIRYDGTGFLAAVLAFFGKDPTISGRVPIWQIAKEYVLESPILGHGAISEDEFVALNMHRYGPHNYFLDVTLVQGIIGYIPYILLVLMPLLNWKSKKRVLNDEVYILSCASLALLIMQMTEVYSTNEMTMIPIMALTAMATADREPLFVIEPIKFVRKLFYKPKHAKHS